MTFETHVPNGSLSEVTSYEPSLYRPYTGKPRVSREGVRGRSQGLCLVLFFSPLRGSILHLKVIQDRGVPKLGQKWTVVRVKINSVKRRTNQESLCASSSYTSDASIPSGPSKQHPTFPLFGLLWESRDSGTNLLRLLHGLRLPSFSTLIVRPLFHVYT